MADKYLLRVTAGPSYDTAHHQPVPVNGPTPIQIDNEQVAVNLHVRIQNYRGLPKGSPSTSPYFSHPQHKHDQYSIAFSILPKRSISGNALVFGNDFDHPIRDRLPPGFNTALKIVKWAIDPGLDGDVNADRPYLYGPALSSLNIVRVGEKVAAEGEGKGAGWRIPATVHEDVIEEGGEGDGVEVRREKGVPEEAERRKKFFLDERRRGEFEFEEGRVYQADFFNPYLDFNVWNLMRTHRADFSLKLPGFTLSILPYLDKRDSLRYVMKNRDTGDVLFVVCFTLVPTADVEREEERETLAGKGEGTKDEAFEPKDDDLD